MEETGLIDNCSVTTVPRCSSSISESKKFSHKLFATDINGVIVDIVISAYSDRYLIIITQLKKLGTLVSIEKDTAHSEGEARTVYSTKVLLGPDEDSVHVAARFLVEQLELDKPVLLSLALKDLGPSVLKTLSRVIKEHLQ